MRPALDRSAEQVALAEAFAAFFAKESPPERVRAAEPRGFDARLWAQAHALGLPEMGLTGGADLADLAVVAEEAGRSLAPIPVVEALVAVRLLERLGQCPADVACGEVIATVAPHAAVDGVVRLAPAGAVADVVVARDAGAVIAVRTGAPGEAPANHGALPIADRSVVDGRFLETADDAASAAWADALDEWRVLTAAALVGVARGALDLAVAYAKVRKQFGVPIGSFQAIQHLLADLATCTDGAALLVRAASVDDDHRRVLAPMASWFAARTARDVAGGSLHVHGGYGFMLEQDVQLFFRRATAWGLALGDPADELERLADALDAAEWTLDTGGAPGPDDQFRAEVGAFLAEHCTPEIVEQARASGTNHSWPLHHALAARGWVAAEWPVEDGGQGRDAWELLDLMEEMARAGAPIDGWGTSNLVAHTLAISGTPEQRLDVVPRILRGEILCCLGYSEPDSGSDVAAAATRAGRDGDGWVINGQKMFTTLAQEAAYVFLLTRTNPDAPKHRGLTMFLVPMDAEGIEITPIATLGGERTNVTFYTEVRVPDSCRVGEIDGGWDVMNVALAFERNPIMVGELEHVVRSFVAWAGGVPGFLDRVSVRTRLARVITDLTVGRLLGIRMTAAVARGELPYADGSMAKLFSSEALVRAASDLLDASGVEGVLAHGAPGVAADGWIEHAHRHAQVTTIQAGTSEIQRTIIAERALGLPRSPR